ncbi:hypothetical protein [Capnocytophaga canis]|uniref:hypothetical protein n=1 Tax=Capnocytophaga canis TaxID=1848903 RepID=UPI0037D037A3
METLKDIFVSYEIAQKLKEIGFDEKCIASYTSAKNIIFELYDLTRHAFKEDLIINDFNSSDRCISAPTWEQVKKWFREKGIESSLFTEDGYYYYRGSKGDKFLFSGTEDTYEQAREALILKLIEIYKNEQDI